MGYSRAARRGVQKMPGVQDLRSLVLSCCCPRNQQQLMQLHPRGGRFRGLPHPGPPLRGGRRSGYVPAVIPGGAKRREGDPAVRVMQGDWLWRSPARGGALHEAQSWIPFPCAARRLRPGMTSKGSSIAEAASTLAPPVRVIAEGGKLPRLLDHISFPCAAYRLQPGMTQPRMASSRSKTPCG